MDPVVQKLVDDVEALKRGQEVVLRAIAENTEMTRPIGEIIGYAKWFFNLLGKIGDAIGWCTRKLGYIMKPVGYIAGGCSAVLVFLNQIGVKFEWKSWFSWLWWTK